MSEEKREWVLRCYGPLRRYVPESELRVRVRAQANVAELRAALAELCAGRASGAELRALLNECAVGDAQRVLRDEDTPAPDAELALLPPVCGG